MSELEENYIITQLKYICPALLPGTTYGSQPPMLTQRKRGWLLPRSIIRLLLSRVLLFLRYGMLPEDYQQYDPVTEADVMAGDYPKLSEKSAMIHLRSEQILIRIK